MAMLMPSIPALPPPDARTEADVAAWREAHMQRLYPGATWWDSCGWCHENKHEKCCWSGCLCRCKPRWWRRLLLWWKTR